MSASGEEGEGQTAGNTTTKPEADHRKPCTICSKLCDVRIRCQIDETGKWHLVCPGKCWKAVSGGVIDGSGNEEHQFYRYGGVWKNKHDAVSGKKPKKKMKGQDGSLGTSLPWSDSSVKYTKNDKVVFEDAVWVCRKSHRSDTDKTPPTAPSLWKESIGIKHDSDQDVEEKSNEAPA